ncbi:MAG: LysE family transporter [Paludibacteraceae bacterium]|nr:LysE family transporter [Paludibacteraceae bacterium]
MLEIIIKGIVIGLFISIPLGPIGMLCIQRTLNRGRKYGIATGLGATTSDLIYTLVTLFFVSFVINVIEENRLLIQVMGSVILVAFGYFIFKSHPSRQPRPNEKNKHSLLSDYLSSFGLTISNPLVLFVLVALFARFEFLNDNHSILEYSIAVISILSGALLWWSTLTFMVSRFRSKLNMRGLKLINQITGVIISVIGIAGIIISAI